MSAPRDTSSREFSAEQVDSEPARVLPGQVWRCTGVDGELEVADVRPEFAGFCDDISLRSVGASGPVTARAREVDMLCLKEWSFVRGPR